MAFKTMKYPSGNDENDEFDLLTDQEIPLVVEQWL